MCDYCGCRSRALIAHLGADHERIGSLVGDIRRAAGDGQDATVRSTAAALAELLERHSALEESGLYPALADAGVETEHLAAEHAAVDAAVRAAAGGAHDAPPLDAALVTLTEHIQREEYDLFPAAHQLLGEETWDRLDAPVADAPDGDDASRDPHVAPPRYPRTDGAEARHRT